MRYATMFLALAMIASTVSAEAAQRMTRPSGNTNSMNSNNDNDASFERSSRSSRRSSGGIGQGKIEVDPAFGFAFISPSDVNSAIRDTNDQAQNAGYKSFNAEDIGSTTYFGLATTYRVMPEFGIGLGFHRLAGSSEGNAKVNEQTLNSKTEISANLLTVESRITVYGSRRERVEVVLSPFMGMGFYKGSSSMSGSAMQNGSTELNSSAKGFVFGSMGTARYWLTQNLAAGLTTGYRFAKSGELTIDSQKNTEQAVGTKVDSKGKKLRVDASSFVVGAALTWAI